MMLKAGQRPKQVLLVAAIGVQEHPTRFAVSRPFADRLKAGDFVQFIPQLTSPPSSLWAKTWRVVRVGEHAEDSRMVFVDEVS